MTTIYFLMSFNYAVLMCSGSFDSLSFCSGPEIQTVVVSPSVVSVESKKMFLLASEGPRILPVENEKLSVHLTDIIQLIISLIMAAFMTTFCYLLASERKRRMQVSALFKKRLGEIRSQIPKSLAFGKVNQLKRELNTIEIEMSVAEKEYLIDYPVFLELLHCANLVARELRDHALANSAAHSHNSYFSAS